MEEKGVVSSSYYSSCTAVSEARLPKTSYVFNGPPPVNNNPESKRRKRVAAYNRYAAQGLGKLLPCLLQSFKWVTTKFTRTSCYEYAMVNQ